MKTVTFTMIMFAMLFLFLAGCAVGVKHSYHDVSLDLANNGNFTVAVTTHDQRSYIVSGEKAPNFVGSQRGGYGNPFDVTTASGNALAKDMTNTIVRSLQAKGYDAVPVTVRPSESNEAVILTMLDESAYRSLMVTLIKWKSDTYQNTALLYNVRVEVLDQLGNILAEKSISGRDNLMGSFWNPPEHARSAIPIAFKEKFETLLNSAEIADALQ